MAADVRALPDSRRRICTEDPLDYVELCVVLWANDRRRPALLNPILRDFLGRDPPKNQVDEARASAEKVP